MSTWLSPSTPAAMRREGQQFRRLKPTPIEFPIPRIKLRFSANRVVHPLRRVQDMVCSVLLTLRVRKPIYAKQLTLHDSLTRSVRATISCKPCPAPLLPTATDTYLDTGFADLLCSPQREGERSYSVSHSARGKPRLLLFRQHLTAINQRSLSPSWTSVAAKRSREWADGSGSTQSAIRLLTTVRCLLRL